MHFIYSFLSKGITQSTTSCNHYPEQTSEQWNGGQHCGCQGDHSNILANYNYWSASSIRSRSDQICCLTLTQGAGQGNLGIYIKSIVKGGPAEMVRTTTVQIQLDLRWPMQGFSSEWNCTKKTDKTEDNLCVQNGNLTAGDQLLSVDGQSLVGLNQER